MTASHDAALRMLAEMVKRISLTVMHAGADDDAVRATAAADVEELRDLAVAVDRNRAPGAPAMFDVVRVTDALSVFAEWLRSPTGINEVRARQAITELQVTVGPLIGWRTVREDPAKEAAEREQHRKAARAALDDHFRDHPIEPVNGATGPSAPAIKPVKS